MDKQRHPNVGPYLDRGTHQGSLPVTPTGEAEVQIAEGSVRRRGEESDPPPAPATQGWPVDTAHIGMVHR